MPDLPCRVAKIEEKLEGLCRSSSEDRDEYRRKMDRVFDSLEELKETNKRQQGFMAGMAFAISLLVTAIMTLTNFFTGK